MPMSLSTLLLLDLQLLILMIFPFDRASETSKIWKAKPAPVTTVGTALLLLACLTLASPDKDFFL